MKVLLKFMCDGFQHNKNKSNQIEYKTAIKSHLTQFINYLFHWNLTNTDKLGNCGEVRCHQKPTGN